MNLYRISQDANADWDTYDSAVVAAESEDKARVIHPSGSDGGYGWTSPENVTVELVGVAIDGTETGVIVASFNAG